MQESEGDRLRKVLEYMEKKRLAIQGIRDIMVKSKEKDEDATSLEVKRTADEIFSHLSAIELLVGGRMSGKMHKEIEQLRRQWLWMETSSEVFHLGLAELPIVMDMWLTNLSTLRIGFDKKRKWSINWKVNPISSQYDGSLSHEDL